MSNELSTVDNASITKLENFGTVEEMRKWASAIIDSGFLPNSITEPEQVITIVQHGQELGLSPHIALNNIHVIGGRPTLSSVILGSLLKRRGVEWVWDEDFKMTKTDQGKEEVAPDGQVNRRTTIHFYWKSEITDRVMDATFSVTWAQFCLSGLVDKDNWKRMPKEIKV